MWWIKQIKDQRAEWVLSLTQGGVCSGLCTLLLQVVQGFLFLDSFENCMHEKCADNRRQQEWLSWATKGLPSSKFSLQWWLKAASGEKQCKGAAPSVPSPELLPRSTSLHFRDCFSSDLSTAVHEHGNNSLHLCLHLTQYTHAFFIPFSHSAVLGPCALPLH